MPVQREVTQRAPLAQDKEVSGFVYLGGRFVGSLWLPDNIRSSATKEHFLLFEKCLCVLLRRIMRPEVTTVWWWGYRETQMIISLYSIIHVSICLS